MESPNTMDIATAKSKSNTHTNAKSKTNSKYGSITEPIKETPFVIRRDEKNGWYTTMGEYRITEPTKTKEEQYNKIKWGNWNFLTTVIATITDNILKQQKNG